MLRWHFGVIRTETNTAEHQRDGPRQIQSLPRPFLFKP